MGGSKNKSPAQKEKSQSDSKKDGGKKSKKHEKGESGSPKAEITVMLTEEQASKYVKNAKVITAYELARQTGVKISAANTYLKQSLQKGNIKKVGGFSGHFVYQPVSA